MSDFKAPDVVYIHKDFVKGLFGAIRENRSNESDVSYTLTTTAEENTRKAVREELEKVLVTVCARCGMDLNDGLDNSYNVFTHADIADQINDILAQYQDPTTEASDDNAATN